MEERFTGNEPTTGEIVRALRCVAEETECKDCRYKYPVGNVILCDHEQMNGNAADRLESQEKTIADLRETLRITCENWSESSNEKNVQIATLTARAESAERERDAIALELDMMRANENENGLCLICKKKCESASNGCFFCKDFEWRGLQPQDGGAE